MIFVLDKKGTYIDYKPDAAGLLEVPPANFLGKTVHEVLSQPIAVQITHYVAETLSTKQIQQFEHDMVLGNKRYSFETRMAALDENHVVSVVRDISEQRHLETAARENEIRYKHLFQNSLASIWEEDFTELQEEIDRLKKEGITDFRKYLDTEPRAVEYLASLIRVIDVNDITLQWYGVETREEMLGGLERFITDETNYILREEIIAIAEGRGSVEGETKGRTLDGKELDISIRISIPAADETPKRMIVAINDITELKKAVEHKEFLMRELNHRVKNNLLLVSSFVRFKEKELGGKVDLSDLQRQVGAIIMIHDDLYTSEEVGSVDIQKYISRIAQSVFSFADRAVTTDLRIKIAYLPFKIAVPVGLIVNEIMTNALKHGFTRQLEAVCTVDFRKDDEDRYILTLSNNGAPFPADIDLEKPKTMGLRLICALVNQLDGSIDLARAPHPLYTITFTVEDG